MKALRLLICLVLCLGFASISLSNEAPSTPSPAPARDLGDPCEHNGAIKLSKSERAGCQIWFYATAGTERFFTYVFQQRLGTLVDWYRVLNAPSRDTRFNDWGLINDPACCKPGDPDCPAKNLEETYGLDYCPGDDVLLTYVGKRGYKDPACDLNDATPTSEEIEYGVRFPKTLWQSSCDLNFGTSAGTMGFRKFPNPRFDKAAWQTLNNGLATWDGFRKKLSDGSIEPPFLIGMSCGACHIAFDPLKPFKPPHSPTYPAVENLSGTVGNQYSRILPIFVSGMPKDSLEYQVFALVRPGTVDTSAIPTDQVNNTGTMNALINLSQRPVHPHDVWKWRIVPSGKQCKVDAPGEQCWCEPGRDGMKCWKRSLTKQEQVHNVLKGGEDSIGILEALQRVYINIGSCSESAWVNHLTDMMQFDPHQRGYGQTPMDIGQARRDCPNFRAIEDRLHDIGKYLFTGRPSDLREARENELKTQDSNARYSDDDLKKDLERDFGAGAVERGRILFAKNCAGCHSSRPEKKFGPFIKRDFRALDANGVREDWLGNDEPTPVTELATSASRALHSNHMAGHLWHEYSAETYKDRAGVDLPVPADGGRGYYRNISFLSLWAYAPFMHNNAIGPELCGGPVPSPDCQRFNPFVEGRYDLFKASMKELLNPDKRTPKITRTNGAKQIGPLGLELQFPDGKAAAAIGNFRHKDFVLDLKTVLGDPQAADKLKKKYASRFTPEEREQVARDIQIVFGEILKNPKSLLEQAHKLSRVYSTSLDLDENTGDPKGHPLFGKQFSEQDKNDLTAFLATL